VVFAICLIAVLLEPLLAPLLQTSGPSDDELQRDVCVREYHNSLGAIDLTGSIAVGEFMGRPPTGEDELYVAEIAKLAAAHGSSASGASYGLKSTYRPVSFPSTGTALAMLWEAGNAKAGRVREYTILRRMLPEVAARVVFADIVKASTGFRNCRADPRQRSALPSPGSQFP
jgi:hypothetical protein